MRSGAGESPRLSRLSWSGGISTAAATSCSSMLPARREARFTGGWASGLSGQSWFIAELARAAGLRFSRAAPALFGLSLVAAQLGHARERTPRPTRQLAIAELLGDPNGVPQVLFRLVEPAQLAFRDPTRRPGVSQLPPGAQLGTARDAAIQPWQRL